MKKQYIILEASSPQELQNKVNNALSNPLCQLQGGISYGAQGYYQALIISAPNKKDED